MNIPWKVGSYAKVLGQDIEGFVVEVYDNSLVLVDPNLEAEDNRLEFRFSDVEPKDPPPFVD
jgi:hypothetical protein